MAALFPEIDEEELEEGEKLEEGENCEEGGAEEGEHCEEVAEMVTDEDCAEMLDSECEPENDSEIEITGMVCNCDKCLAARNGDAPGAERVEKGCEESCEKARVPDPSYRGQRKETKATRRRRFRKKTTDPDHACASVKKRPSQAKPQRKRGLINHIHMKIDEELAKEDAEQGPKTPITCPVTVTRRMKGDKYVSGYLMHCEAGSTRRVYLAGISLKKSGRFMELLEDCAQRCNDGELTTKSTVKAYLEFGAMIPRKTT